MKKIAFILLCTLVLVSCQEEGEELLPQEETLKQQWKAYKEASGDENKIVILDKILKQAREFGNDEYIGRALYSKGLVAKRSDNSGLALKDFIDADQYLKAANKELLHADVVFNIGDVLQENNDHEGAIKYFEEAVKIYESNNDYKYSISGYINLGLAHTHLLKPDYRTAKKYFSKALDIVPNLQKKRTYFQNRLYTLIGMMHYNAYEYDLAISNYNKSIEFADGEALKLAIAYNNIGEVYLSMDDKYDEASDWINKSLALLPEESSKAPFLIVQGELYQKSGKLEESFKLLYDIVVNNGDQLLIGEKEKALALANTSLVALRGQNTEISKDMIIDIANTEYRLRDAKAALARQLTSEKARSILDQQESTRKLESTIGQLRKELSDTVGEKTSYIMMLSLMVLATVGLYIILRKATKKYVVIKGKYQKSQAFDLELLNRIKNSGFIDNFQETDQTKAS